METWHDTNIYTTKPELWLELMNLSTAEFSIGFLPPNVVAIPWLLRDNQNITIPPGSFVIENASQTLFRSRKIEDIIFGATSGLAILVASIWLAWHLYHGTLFSPKSAGSADDDASSQGNNINHDHSRGTPDYKFKAQIDVYYGHVPELELYQRTIGRDPVSAEDVEAGIELLRKRYERQLYLIAIQGSHDDTPEVRNRYGGDVAALKEDFEQLLESWQRDRHGGANTAAFTPEEEAEINEMINMIDGR